MLSGWEVLDTNGYASTIVDDGAKLDVAVNTGGDTPEKGSALWNNLCLRYPSLLTGDFSAELKMNGESNMTGNSTWVGLSLGRRGDSTPDAAFNSGVLGVATSTNAQCQWSTGLATATGSALRVIDGVNVSWATAQWVQIKRVSGTVTVSRKTLDGDAWTVVESDNIDVTGAEFYLHIYCKTQALKTFSLLAVNFDGFLKAV